VISANISDDALHCPECGGGNLHQGRVEVFHRHREDMPSTVIGIADGVVVDADAARNPSSRRQGLLIQFDCENCPAEPSLAIYQHKGTTFVLWRDRVAP
jgi:hypothetical protein